MERRNFIAGTIIFLGAIKSVFANGKSNVLPTSKTPKNIDNVNDVVYLKRNEVVKLPENPESINTIITFDVKKYRFGKSPEIHLNGQKIDGEKRDVLVLTKDIKLHNRTQFMMQYTGEDVGWIITV